MDNLLAAVRTRLSETVYQAFKTEIARSPTLMSGLASMSGVEVIIGEPRGGTFI